MEFAAAVEQLRGRLELCSVEVRASGASGRGLFATRPIAEGEVLLEVPRDAVVTEASCRQWLDGWFGAAGANAAKALSRDGAFCAWLLVGRADLRAQREATSAADRHRLAYAATLPAASPCLLDFATDRELALLENQMRRRQLLARRDSLRSLYSEVQSFFAAVRRTGRLQGGGGKEDDDDVAAPGEVLWAYSIIDSRAFSVTAEEGYGLIPLADMFNHCAEGITDYGVPDTGAEGASFYFKAPKAYLAGEEVFLRYNSWMGHFHFARNYGFVPVGVSRAGGGYAVETSSLPTQRYAIALPYTPPGKPAGRGGYTGESAKERVARAARERLLAAYDCEAGGLFEGGLVDDRTVRGLRFLSLSAGFEGLERAVGGDVVGVDNELCAYTKLVSVLRGELAQYTTTTQEDLRVLTDPAIELPPCVRLCVTVRVLDKRLLAQALHRTLAHQAALAALAYSSAAADPSRLPPPPPSPSPLPKAPVRHISAVLDRALGALQAVAKAEAAPVKLEEQQRRATKVADEPVEEPPAVQP